MTFLSLSSQYQVSLLYLTESEKIVAKEKPMSNVSTQRSKEMRMQDVVEFIGSANERQHEGIANALVESCNLKQLTDLQDKISASRETIKTDTFQKVREENMATAAKYGLSPEDYREIYGGKNRGKVAAKFANPANPQETWTGRGRQPKWMASLVAGLSEEEASKKLNEFKIKSVD